MMWSRFRVWLVLPLFLLMGGCSISAPVHSITRIEGKILTFDGIAVGYLDRTGTIDMQSADGVNCTGEFRYTGTRTGIGSLTCSNGEKAKIQFTALGAASGYGYGTSSSGYPIAFTFGLSEEHGKQYLKLSDEFAASQPKKRIDTDKGGSGSGFAISKSIFITNAHVVDGCSTVKVGHSSHGAFDGEVIARDKVNDLAAVKVTAWPGIVLLWEDRPIVKIGERVATFGYPYGGAIASAGSLSTGDINALAGLGDDSRFLQISVPVQPGNSGGPLVNLRGHLVGIVTSKLNALKIASLTGDVPQNVNFGLKTGPLELFLSTHGIPKSTANGNEELKMTRIGEILSNSTAKITCEP